MKKNHYPDFTSPGFTLVELLAVIAIIAVLAGIIIPVTSKVRTKAEVTQSISNLRQVHGGISLYTIEHNNHLPYQFFESGAKVYLAREAVDPYLPFDSDSWLCPIIQQDALKFPNFEELKGRYYINFFLRKTDEKDALSLMSDVVDPSEAMLAANLDVAARGGYGDGYANVLFVDGSVKRIQDDSLVDSSSPQTVSKLYLKRVNGKISGYNF